MMNFEWDLDSNNHKDSICSYDIIKSSLDGQPIKDTTINHSKLLRKIEVSMQQLMLSFNIGVIVQMTWKEKVNLMKKLN
jgi:hypothetical protein